MPINRHRGYCRYCAKVVGARKGSSERSKTSGGWLVWHDRCEPKAAPPEPLVDSTDHEPASPPYYLRD